MNQDSPAGQPAVAQARLTPGVRVRIRERPRTGGDRYRDRVGVIVRTHFAGFYVRLDMTTRERTQKVELVETGYIERLADDDPPPAPS